MDLEIGRNLEGTSKEPDGRPVVLHYKLDSALVATKNCTEPKKVVTKHAST